MNNTRDQKTTAKHIQSLTDESASLVDKARAISVIAYDGLYEYEPQIRELVNHPDHYIRAKALFHLVGTWGRIDLLDTALYAALHDPSSFTRSEVYGALANLLTQHKQTDPDIAQRVLTTLVAALLRENQWDWDQLSSAYNAILQILDGVYPQYARKSFNRDTDVDWARLKPYREAAEQLDFIPAEF